MRSNTIGPFVISAANIEHSIYTGGQFGSACIEVIGTFAGSDTLDVIGTLSGAIEASLPLEDVEENEGVASVGVAGIYRVSLASIQNLVLRGSDSFASSLTVFVTYSEASVTIPSVPA